MRHAIIACALVLCVGVTGTTALAQDRGEAEDQRPGGPDMVRLRMFGGFMNIIEQVARMTRDPSTAGVAAALSAGDMLRKQGPDALVNYFNKLLPDVKNTATKNAIRLQLIEVYKSSGQTDKALEQLRQIMLEAPAGNEPPPPPPPQNR